MVLHTFNASPANSAFDDCLSVLADTDAIVLIGDGVYAAIAGTAYLSQLLTATTEVYLLRDDATAAGVLDSLGDVAVIDMDGLVELTERYSRQLAWF